MKTEEEIKCNFQQTYNVFGLDDKPCCYLYHKYCDEIENCYFKRCERLKQENETINKDLLTERQENAELATENYKLRSALEEIKTILDKECGVISNAKVVGIINEVLGDEGN